MALGLIKECRRRNVDYIVAPYEADAQLAYLNIKNIAQLVITQDSDLIVFGCSKVLCKMNTKGKGVLFESDKLPLVMKCPVQQYSFNKFRQMCILSGCDYLESLPGIGLVKARQFVTATQDPNIANALKRLPSTLNKTNLVVTDEYRERFLKAEASFKHQYVYDPLERQMVRLTEPDDEDIQWCVSAGELLDPEIAFQLALGNLYPLTLKKIDDWRPDNCSNKNTTYGWLKQTKYPSIWSPDFKPYINEARPWEKKVRKVPPTKAQDESLSVQSTNSMYYGEPATKKLKMDYDKQDGTLTKYTQVPHDTVLLNNKSADSKVQSPVVDLTDLKTPSKSLGLKNYYEFKKKIVHKRM